MTAPSVVKLARGRDGLAGLQHGAELVLTGAAFLVAVIGYLGWLRWHRNPLYGE